MQIYRIHFVLFLSVIIKILAAFYLPVFGDESYYWFWGQHPQLSYFDHPGMVGWLTAVGSKFSFLPMNFLVRWPFIVMSTFSFWLFIKIIRLKIKSPETVLWLTAFYLLNPMLGLGGIFATPDVGLVFFWTLSYWITLQIIEKQKSQDYAFLGLCLGLGLCAKYHIVLFPVSIILGLWLSKELHHIQFRKLGLTVFFGLIFSLPVLIWNLNNDWASFAFQINHGFNGQSYTPSWMITYVLGQIFLFNPFLFYLLFTNRKKTFIHQSAFIQWVFFLISSMRASVEANWPITAHIQGVSALQTEIKKYFKHALVYSLILWSVACVYLITPFGEKKLKNLPNSTTAKKIWSDVSGYSPLYGPTYQMSSLLQLVSGREVLKLNGLSRIDFYDSKQFAPPTNKIFYVLKYNVSTWPEWLADAQIKEIKKIPGHNLTLHRIEHE